MGDRWNAVCEPDRASLYSCGEHCVEAAPQAMAPLYLPPVQVHRVGPEDCDRDGPA